LGVCLQLAFTFSVLVLGMFFGSGCSSLLYAPNNALYVDPKQVQLAYEEIIFKSEESKLHGWYFTQTAFAKPRGVILFFHGNGQNRSSHFLALKWVLEKGYDYFIFDYRGYGDSEGEATAEHTVKDGVAALHYVINRNPALPLAVFGQSLGGAVAMRSVVEFKKEEGSFPDQLKMMILDSTFLSYQRAAASVLSKHVLTFLFQPFALLVSDQWSPSRVKEDLPRVPVAVLHGTDDQMIDEKLGTDVFDAFQGPKTFKEVKGGHHISALYDESGEYRDFVWLQLEKFMVPASPQFRPALFP
jgi:fermentation-respiration switch protein FrsA (DUF1100 family)